MSKSQIFSKSFEKLKSKDFQNYELKNSDPITIFYEKNEALKPLILNDESSWVDIAIEAVKSRIQPTNGTENELLSQEEAENYFLSMIEYFNNIRETERDKRCAEFNKAWETTSDPKALKEAEEIIKDYSSPYKSSSNGCMLILPFLISSSFAFCYFVLLLL